MLDGHLQGNTLYNEPSGNFVYTARSYIIESVERLMDSGRTHIRALSLPDSFIDGNERGVFWKKIATIASGEVDLEGWHEMEYGGRYVYTWVFEGSTFKFYTKTMPSGKLVWFMCRLEPDEENSGCETDCDEIL
jgi:hypothetical protein